MYKITSTLLITFVVALATQRSYAGSANWNLNPTSDDWNTAANWTPVTVPNSPRDTARFGVSNLTDVFIQGSGRPATDLLNGIVFDPGASPFTISIGGPVLYGSLEITGAGITNNSGTTQNFVVVGFSGVTSTLEFLGSATTGSQTVFTNNANGATSFFGTSSAGDAVFVNNLGQTVFLENSTAANGTFTNQSDVENGGTAGRMTFQDESTAGNGYFTNKGENAFGGFIWFLDNSKAGSATFINERNHSTGTGALILFSVTTSADHGTFICEGGPRPSSVEFRNSATAGDATFTLEGSSESGSLGAAVTFYDTSSAGNSTLSAENGPATFTGGTISFQGDSDGGTAQIEANGSTGKGTLSIEFHNSPGVTIGSLEGSGLASLGANRLTVGANNLSTTFSGNIRDGLSGNVGGSLTKVGTGTLTLSGANNYTGGTTVSEGTLAIANRNGSGTGTGAVAVDAGTLGGNGTVTGAVTVGTGSGAGAFLAPATGGKVPMTFTTSGPLTLKADATYTYTLRAKTTRSQTDTVVANGVTILGATFSFRPKISGILQPGTVFTVISNSSASQISGTFTNLPDGGIITTGSNSFQASYEGGDGNDLTLTVVP